MASPMRNAHNRVVDHDLDSFVHGKFEEPEARVGRECVPDYRQMSRESHKRRFTQSKPNIYNQMRRNKRSNNLLYLPLSDGEIRLLRIHPKAPTTLLVKKEPEELQTIDPIRCDLAVFKLSQVVGLYEALSYCWGDETARHRIWIRTVLAQDGTSQDLRFSDERSFPVKPNLYNALLNLRGPTKPLLFWVDAICIDQNESEDSRREKDQQLSMMSEIYNSAKNVCIWLGEEDPSGRAERALQFIRDIMDFSMLDKHACTPETATLERWCDLIHSVTAAWFGRRWIIQEVAMARQASVHFGRHMVHWDDLADAISLLSDQAAELKNLFPRSKPIEQIPRLSAVNLVGAIGNVCRKSEDGSLLEKLLDLETLVSTFQQFEARYAEDIIHSVRALATDPPDENDQKNFKTTYQADGSTRDLFIAFVRRCIERSNSLDIICRHWAPPPKDSANEVIALPSWISGLENSPFGLPGGSGERQNAENFVAMTLPDKRKRYSASLGQGVMNNLVRTIFPDSSSRLPRSHIPKISISATTPAPQTLVLDVEYSASPAVSPVLVREDPFQYARVEKRQFEGNGDENYSSNKPTSAHQYPHNIPEGSLILPAEPEAQNGPSRNGSQHSSPELSDLEARNRTSLSRSAMNNTLFSARENGVLSGLDKITESQFPILDARDISTDRLQFEASTKQHAGLGISSSHVPRINTSWLGPQGMGDPQMGLAQVSKDKAGPSLLAIANIRNNRIRTQSMSSVMSTDSVGGSALHSTFKASLRQLARRWRQDDKEHQTKADGILMVTGFILGKVKQHSDVMRKGVVAGVWLKKLGWDSSSTEKNRVPDLVWRTLVADRNPEGGNPPGWYPRACLHCLKDSRVTDSNGDMDSNTSEEISSLTARYLERVKSVTWNRRVIEVQTDGEFQGPLFGLAPRATQAGDIVCILYGCSVPVIIRRIEETTDLQDSSKTLQYGATHEPAQSPGKSQKLDETTRGFGPYEVIGETYIHGNMDGEAVKDKGRIRKIETVFLLE